MANDEKVAQTRNPEGRLVELFARTWEHVLGGHPEMGDHLSDVIQTIEQPEHREPDPNRGRERFFRRGGSERWLRVVTQLADGSDRVVTAFPQSNDPVGWRP